MLSAHPTNVIAIALSMIVEMTSLTPRVTLSTPAMPAHAAPTNIATRIAKTTLNLPGNSAKPATMAAEYDAMVYCPSTPMLKRFIRKPTAAAIAEMKIIELWLAMFTQAREVGGLRITDQKSLRDAPATTSTRLVTSTATTSATSGAAMAPMILRVSAEFMPGPLRRSWLRRDPVA